MNALPELAPMSQRSIEVRDLRKDYPTVRSYRRILRSPFEREVVPALRGISFEVEPGQVFGILGPNGAGKTTLIKILTSLISPTSGTARVFGHDVAVGGPEVLSKVGLVVSDERSFYWRLTVRQNLRFFATLNDFERGPREARIAELLGVLGCEEYADRPFRNLSTGIRQRVAVARALLMDPPLLLMDEPTSSMDPRAARELREWLRQQLVEGSGKSILLVTHDPLEAEFLCDEVAILSEGRFVHRASVAAMRERGTASALWRLRVGGWSADGQAALLQAGWDVREIEEALGGLHELEVRGGDQVLGELLSLMSRHGISIHDCSRRRDPFSAAIADLLEEAAGAGETS